MSIEELSKINLWKAGYIFMLVMQFFFLFFQKQEELLRLINGEQVLSTPDIVANGRREGKKGWCVIYCL
jgi:hypothetical protein